MAAVNVKQRLSQVWEWYVNFTAVSVVPQICQKVDNKISRTVWGLLGTAGSIVTIVAMYQAITSYLAYGTVTSVGMVSQSDVDFPAVTICNQNRIHCKHLHKLIIDCTMVG